MSFFKDRTIWDTLIVAFLSSAVMYAAILYLPYFIQGVLGTSATTSGAVTLPMTLALMATSNIIGIFATHRSNLFRPVTIAAFILAAIGLLLLSMMTVNTSYLSVIVYMIILGAGLGVTMPIANTNVQNAAPIEQLSSATGSIQFFRTIGSTIGSAIFGAIMTSSIASGFASLDLSGVPATIQSSLRKPAGHHRQCGFEASAWSDSPGAARCGHLSGLRRKKRAHDRYS